jgi:adenylate kinase
MKLILLGAPGCGKGTQAAYISDKYGLPHVSTGDIFRQNIKDQTPLGVKVKQIIDSGNFCPDDITVQLVESRLLEADCKDGYLLDGFPRNLFQAQELDKFSAPDAVIELDVDLSKIEHRITGRRSCPKCGNSFHVDFIGDTKVCPDCGETLVIRKDDTPETVKERLSIYSKQTAPLVEYYQKQGKLLVIDGNKAVDEVFKEIVKVLG